MIRNYFFIAVRHFQKQKFSSIINVIGLTIAFATCLLIFLFVFDELKYDQYQENKDHTYRLLTQNLETGDRNAIFPAVLYPQLLSQTPDIEKGFRLYCNHKQLIKFQDKQFIDNIFFADKEILEILTLTLVKGNKGAALAEPFSVVITEDIANKYFGNVNPIGELLTIENKYDLKVTGVLKNIPEHSHIQPTVIASISTLVQIQPFTMESKDNSSCNFYFYLNEHADKEVVQDKLMLPVKEFWGEHVDKVARLVLEPVDEIYLYSTDTKWDIADHGDINTVISFISISILIIIMAAFNFTNLLSTLVKIREKEFAIRKLLGARRRSIIKQFLFETFFYLLLSIVLSFLIIELLLDDFNSIAGKQLTVMSLFEWKILVSFFVVIVLTALFSIAYPTFITFRSDSLDRLKGSAYASDIKLSNMKLGFRQIVTGIQFVITIVLIVAAIVIYDQMTYARNAKLGFNKEHLLVIENPWNRKMFERYQNYKNIISHYTGVEAVSACDNVPGENINNYTDTWLSSKSKQEAAHCAQLAVDYDLFDTWQVKLTSGRGFSKEIASDISQAVIINQAAVDLLGLDSPIGAKLNGLNNAADNQVIIGVVENIHFKSFKEKVLPIVFYLRQWSSCNIVVRLKSNNLVSTINKLETEWEKIVPDRPFMYAFVDESFDKLYASETRMTKLVVLFCTLSVIISFIGLLSLVNLVSQMRTKEIGIRKVLGATVLDVTGMMIREYLFIIIIANVLAIPIAYYFLNKWLEKFVYRIDINALPFIVAGFFALTVGLTAVIYRIIKSANTNPVEALRYE